MASPAGRECRPRAFKSRKRRRVAAIITFRMDELLTPENAAKLCEELAKAAPHAGKLGLQLGLQKDKIDAIKSAHQRDEDQLIQVISAFLKKASPKPTRRVIVEALRSPTVNLPALAMRVEADHRANIPASMKGLTRFVLARYNL